MISRILSPLLLVAGVAQAAILPLQSGTYVLAGVPCRDPPFAAMFHYDGHQFSYPHASKCHSTIVSRQRGVYRVRETCSALGDGSAAAPSTTVTNYIIMSAERVAVRRGMARRDAEYRRCSPAKPGKGA